MLWQILVNIFFCSCVVKSFYNRAYYYTWNIVCGSHYMAWLKSASSFSEIFLIFKNLFILTLTQKYAIKSVKLIQFFSLSRSLSLSSLSSPWLWPSHNSLHHHLHTVHRIWLAVLWYLANSMETHPHMLLHFHMLPLTLHTHMRHHTQHNTLHHMLLPLFWFKFSRKSLSPKPHNRTWRTL